jgi:hypothetical protein
MNQPGKSSIPPRRERNLPTEADDNGSETNIQPRRIDAEHALETTENSTPQLRRTGHSPQVELSSGETRRRRRSHQDSSKRTEGRSRSLNFKILISIGVLVVFAGSNILVGRFFYGSGVSEGIQRGIDARTPAKDEEPASVTATNKAFAALLNLRGSKPDRASTEMITLLCLQALSETPDEYLPAYLSQGHTTPEDFCAAYVAMRLGDFGKAAAILRTTEPTIPSDFFNYLMNDPVMRRFAKEPRVMGFYEKS